MVRHEVLDSARFDSYGSVEISNLRMCLTSQAIGACLMDHAAEAGVAVAAFALGQLVREAEYGFAFGKLAAGPEGGFHLTHGESNFWFYDESIVYIRFFWGGV